MPRRSLLVIWLGLLVVALGAVVYAWRGWRQEQTESVLAGVPTKPDLSRWPAEFGRRLQAEEAAIRSEHEPIAALGRLASLYFANNFPNEAGRAISVLREVDPKNARWAYFAADLRQRVGDQPGAESALREATAIDPGYAPAWLRLGDVLVERESFADAGPCYARALTLAPESVRARFSQILFDAYHSPHVDSRSALLALVGDHPDIKPLHELLALMDEAAGDHAGSVGQQRLAATSSRLLPRDDPWLDGLFVDCYDPDMLNVMTFEMVREGRYDDAVARIERAISLAPGTAPLREAFARVRLAQGRTEDALTVMHTGVKECPDDPALRESLAALLRREHRHDEAQTVIRDALTRWPQRAALHAELGRTLAAAGRTEPALAALRESIRLDPARADTHFALAAVLRDAGQRDDARAATRQALQLRPAYPEALELEAHLALDDGDIAGAETPITQLIALRPDDAGAQRLFATLQLQRGNILRKSGYLPGVEQTFLAGLKVCPDSLPLLRELGLLMREDGRTGDAQRMFARGLEAATAAGDQTQVVEFKKLLNR